MRVGSLFSGYGGLDLAVSAFFGGTVAWYSEIEPSACRVMKAHHPGTPNIGDVTTVDWGSVPPVDILTGGYPCQPFSTAGARKGTNDERHLWPYVRDAIGVLRPRIAVLENVRGHLTLGFDVVLADLADMGWSARWGVVRASDAGAPHRRERLFIVATLNAGHDAGGTEFGEQQETSTGGSVQSSSSVTDAGGGQLPGPAERRGLPVSAERSDVSPDPEGAERGAAESDDLCETLGSAAEPRECVSTAADSEVVKGRSGVHDDATERQQGIHKPAWRGFAPADPGGERHGIREDAGVVGRLDGEDRRAREEPRTGGPAAWGDYWPAILRWEQVLGRPAPAATVRRADRDRLNPEFVEWMMGLPDGWVTGHGLSASQELKMLGNGVVPQQAFLALSLLGVD